jgi:hypothetical protein
MKKIITLLFITISLNSFSQIDPGWNGLQPKDSCNFETNNQRLVIDTSNVNNDWVIGSTNKLFFGQANSLPNAIMTDSMNSYSPNNWSYFDLNFSAWDGSGFPFNMYIQFDHKYETDSLIDGGFITVSHDSGQTWVNIINDSSCIGCYSNWPFINSENLYNNNDTLMNGNFGFSGTSDWKTTTIQWIWMLPVKLYVSDSLIVRFNFISDNIQTNKDGWIIDNIIMGDIYLGSSIEELSNGINVTLFPNVTTDYFSYQIESGGDIQSIVITNIAGATVLSIQNPISEDKIDVSNLPSGNYFVKFLSKDNQTIKRLVIN